MTIPLHSSGKKINLCIHNEGLRLFVVALLGEWGYIVTPECPEDPEQLLLTTGICSRCGAHRKRVDLTSSADLGSDQVKFPIVFEELWRVLEKLYHLTPRHYLRLAVDLPIVMTIRGETQSGRLNSLSPLGGRLTLPRELAVGEHIPVVLPLPRQTHYLSGKVIYVATFPDSNNRYDAGVLFEGITAEEKALLRDAIVLAFLKKIRPQLPHWAFEVGISHFDLPPSLLRQL